MQLKIDVRFYTSLRHPRRRLEAHGGGGIAQQTTYAVRTPPMWARADAHACSHNSYCICMGEWKKWVHLVPMRDGPLWEHFLFIFHCVSVLILSLLN